MSASPFDLKKTEIEVSEEMIQGALEAVYMRDDEFYSGEGYNLSPDLLKLIFITMNKIHLKSGK